MSVEELKALQAERDAALARVVELEAALAPFADQYECWPEEWPDSADNMEFACIHLTKGDFAKAAKVIKEAIRATLAAMKGGA